ncbi:acyl-CoA dehydrogenase family protein [Sporichthya sp.]|uniref:acyl-CoA dehydrogenase family protein n=1 Tax=Sporichthya sp. TaxID=65475 RepID=UPI0017AFF780|nr:acyl-CoA dehydrogenase family protein [Sporichthya sp.]MBA3742510.1 acyl-CoA dehydrogenase family protein [Sporichthya sp.]
MDFSITPEQEHLVQAARTYAAERIAPFYQQRQAEERFDRATLLEMGKLGFFGVELPEAAGGLGLDALTAGLVLEAISAADYNLGYHPVTVSLVGQILHRYGAPEVVEPYLHRMTAGELIPNIALTEPGAGSDAANLQLRARRSGDGWVLSGEKTSISMATQADFTVLFARTGAPDSRAHGVSAFLVPLTDDPTITRSAFNDHGSRSAGRGTMHFDDTLVPADHLLGEENRAFAGVMTGFDYSRALIGLQSLAVARVSLDETWAYANQRETFGAPLSERQGVTFPLAEAETYYEAARTLCHKTLWLKDNGLPHTTEAAMCKWWAPKVSYDAVMACLLTHGHGGYSDEFPFEQRLRDLLGLQIGDGTAQIMKMVIARRKGKDAR